MLLAGGALQLYKCVSILHIYLYVCLKCYLSGDDIHGSGSRINPIKRYLCCITDGLDKTCQGCRIRKLVEPRIHSDQLSHSRVDVNAELVIGVCRVQILKGLSEGKGPCRVPHASEPYWGWMDKVVPPLGVTCWRAGRDGIRMMSILEWPNLGGHPKTNIQSRAELVDAVMRLQKELEEFRAEYGYGSAGRSVIPAQTSDGSRCTSTSVPMYAGNSSWGQYRHVLEAIVCPNK